MLSLFISWLSRWFSRRHGLGPSGVSSTAAPESTAAPPRDDVEASRKQTLAVLGQLSALTGVVSEQVTEHSSNISAIDSELAGVEQGDAQAVAAAIHKLLQANATIQQRLEQAEMQLRAQQRQLAAVACAVRTDDLTGLLNRRALDEKISQCLTDYHRNQRPSVLLMVDVDHFKQFNDQYGHVVGDVVLRHVADVLLANTREMDVVARFGGEEFAIVLQGATATTVLERAEKTRAAIGQSACTVEGRPLRVTASAGLTEMAQRDTAASLLARADSALYAAKHNGRDCCYWNDGTQNVPLPLPVDQAVAVAPRDEPEWSAKQRPAVELSAEQFADPTFVPDIARRIAEWRRGGTEFAVILGRLTEAGAWRDTLGESGCQALLRDVCQRAYGHLRHGDLITRWMQDGVAVLLPGATTKDAVKIARRLRAGLENEEVAIAGQAVKLRLILGVAEGIEGNDEQRVLSRAWQALQSSAEMQSTGVHLHDGVRVRPCVAGAGR
jgi:diguanylate cyclase